MISFRHYGISVTPSGLRKNLKQLLQRKEIPDLGNFQDVSEFITKSGYGSESEGEDAEASRVTLSQDLGRGNTTGRQSRIRLQEVRSPNHRTRHMHPQTHTVCLCYDLSGFFVQPISSNKGRRAACTGAAD